MPRKKLPVIIGYVRWSESPWTAGVGNYIFYCQGCGRSRMRWNVYSKEKMWQIRLGDLKMFSQSCDSCRREINPEASTSMPQLFNNQDGRRTKLPNPEQVQRRQ